MKSFRIFLPLVLLCAALAACGKSGLPNPGDPTKAFNWQTYEAKTIGSCLAFSGKLEGAYSNLDAVRLELAPINDDSDCPGCPFVAKETVTFSPKEAGLERNSGAYSFSYCPSKAQAFRWRLVGINIYSSLPYAVTPVQFTPMEPEKSSPKAP